jgi:hypothetical protein
MSPSRFRVAGEQKWVERSRDRDPRVILNERRSNTSRIETGESA